MTRDERILAALRSWKQGLITTAEACELVGVDTEPELLAAARRASSGRAELGNVSRFPVRHNAAAVEPARVNGAVIRSRR